MREVRSDKNCVKARWLCKWGSCMRKRNLLRELPHICPVYAVPTASCYLPSKRTDWMEGLWLSLAQLSCVSTNSTLTAPCASQFHRNHIGTAFLSVVPEKTFSISQSDPVCTLEQRQGSSHTSFQNICAGLCFPWLVLTQAKNICLKFLYIVSRIKIHFLHVWKVNETARKPVKIKTTEILLNWWQFLLLLFIILLHCT